MTQKQVGDLATARQLEWAKRFARSDIQNLLSSVSGNAQILSFALGLPDQNLFPTQAIADAAVRVLAKDGRALQYTPPSAALKEQIVEIMASRGVECSASEVFLTSGAQQGLSLLLRLLGSSKSYALVDKFTYPGFLQAAQAAELDLVPISSDPENGIDLVEIENKLHQDIRPAFIYLIPEGHNPLGYSLSEKRRLKLVELASAYSVPIIEDDAYGFLQYSGTQRAPLRAYGSECVLYVGSFAKILAPSLRVGWLVVPESMHAPLSALKESSDIDLATFSQKVLNQYLLDNRIFEHIYRLKLAYAEKGDRLVAGLNKMLRGSISFQPPRSGVFLWISVDPHIDSTELLTRCLKRENLAFVPGDAFSVDRHSDANNCFRLNFSHQSNSLIDDGVERLARVIHSWTAS